MAFVWGIFSSIFFSLTDVEFSQLRAKKLFCQLYSFIVHVGFLTVHAKVIVF